MTDQPYPDKVQDTPQIPEVYLTAIGKVSVNWGALRAIG